MNIPNSPLLPGHISWIIGGTVMIAVGIALMATIVMASIGVAAVIVGVILIAAGIAFKKEKEAKKETKKRP